MTQAMTLYYVAGSDARTRLHRWISSEKSYWRPNSAEGLRHLRTSTADTRSASNPATELEKFVAEDYHSEMDKPSGREGAIGA